MKSKRTLITICVVIAILIVNSIIISQVFATIMKDNEVIIDEKNISEPIKTEALEVISEFSDPSLNYSKEASEKVVNNIVKLLEQ